MKIHFRNITNKKSKRSRSTFVYLYLWFNENKSMLLSGNSYIKHKQNRKYILKCNYSLYNVFLFKISNMLDSL